MITQQIVWAEAIQRIMNPIHAAFAILFGALLMAIKGTQYAPRALVELRIVSPKLPKTDSQLLSLGINNYGL